MIGRGRVLPREQAEGATTLRPSFTAAPRLARGRVAPRLVVEAWLQAEQLLGGAW